MRIPLAACGACCLLAATVAAQSTQTRFQEMDDNSDGVITRNEWRGSERAFRDQPIGTATAGFRATSSASAPAPGPR